MLSVGERLHRLERLPGVVGHVAAAGVVIHQLDDAALVDCEGDALDLLAPVLADTQPLPELPALVRQQLEGQGELGGEFGVGRRGVSTDAEDLGAGRGELLVQLAEGGRFLRSTAGVGLGIEEQHQMPLARDVRQADLAAVVGGQHRRRQAIAHVDPLPGTAAAMFRGTHNVLRIDPPHMGYVPRAGR